MVEKVTSMPIPVNGVQRATGYGIVPDHSEDYFVVGDFSKATLRYLSDITDGAPVELVSDPFVFLTPPSKPLPWADVEGVLNQVQEMPPVELVYKCARTVYNAATARAERVIGFEPLSSDEKFYPYFVWLQDPNRSLASRNFMLSLDNSMHADRETVVYVVYPRLVKVSSEEGAAFNIIANSEIGRLGTN